MYKKNEHGMTTVNVIVTIIVVLLLLGLAIVLRQNWMKTKEEQQTNKASQNTQNIENSVKQTAATKSQIENYKNDKTIISEVNNTAIKDDEGNTITIPAGFKIASDSATTQENGIVIEDKDGNQFVWIPVANISNYERTDFGSKFDNGGYSSYSETLPDDEKTSVDKYHGYYIGRYESGDSVLTASKTLREAGQSLQDKISIKKLQTPYNNVTRDQAKTLAEGMHTGEGYKATTKLCSSYAWDTAIRFIQDKVTDFGISSNQGNYNNTTFNYIDITGNSKTKALNSSVLIPTGETTPVGNIYDMGGNEWEWTTETCNIPRNNGTYRGGGYSVDYANYPSGYRASDNISTSGLDIGFRITLYM